MTIRDPKRGNIQQNVDDLLVQLADLQGVVAGLGSGGGVKAYSYVVGNVAEGDTAADCDFLDTGNGNALREALAEALATGASVFVKRGTYPLRSVSGQTVVSVPVFGEGDSTILQLPSSGQMYSLQVQNIIMNCAISMVGNPTGALLDTTNRFIDIDGSGQLVNCLVRVNATVGTVANYPGFWSIVRMGSPGAQMINCRVRGYSSTALGAGSECLGVMAIGGHCRVRGCTFGDVGSDLFDTAVEVGEGNNNLVESCTILRSRLYGIRLIAVFDMYGNVIRNNTIVANSGVGIGSMFVGDSVVRNTQITGNYIEASATVTQGINCAGTAAGRRFIHLMVTNNVLRGGGAGTGISISESGGAQNQNVGESLNSVFNFGTARSVAATGGGLVQVGNVP